MKRVALLSIIISVASLFVAASDPEIKVPLRFDHYYTYEQLVEAVKALNKAYPDLSTLELVLI